jgi:hypothetical protein
MDHGQLSVHGRARGLHAVGRLCRRGAVLAHRGKVESDRDDKDSDQGSETMYALPFPLFLVSDPSFLSSASLNNRPRQCNGPEDAQDYLWWTQDLWMRSDVWEWANKDKEVKDALLKTCQGSKCVRKEVNLNEFKKCAACKKVQQFMNLSKAAKTFFYEDVVLWTFLPEGGLARPQIRFVCHSSTIRLFLLRRLVQHVSKSNKGNNIYAPIHRPVTAWTAAIVIVQ